MLQTSVILCTYNRARSLELTLTSLARMTTPSEDAWELIVVDNNSNDGTAEVVEDFSRRSSLHARYLFEPRQGKTFALITGIAASRGDVLAFTDDDVTVSPAWLSSVVATFTTWDCLGVAGRIVPAWDGEYPRWLDMTSNDALLSVIGQFDCGPATRPITIPPFAANMAFRRSAFDRYGPFRQDLGRTGATGRAAGFETEFAMRLLRSKERIVYCPDALVYHRIGPAQLRKAYFRRYWFQYGRFRARTDVGHADVPRAAFSQLRIVVVEAAKALLLRGARRRFYHDLKASEAFGEVVESVSRALKRLKTGETVPR